MKEYTIFITRRAVNVRGKKQNKADKITCNTQVGLSSLKLQLPNLRVEKQSGGTDKIISSALTELSSFKFQSSNDGKNTINWSNDTWDTFWFQTESIINQYKLYVGVNEYTSWEKFYYNPITWKRIWNRTNFDNAGRVDILNVNLEKQVYNEDINWTNIKGYIWWWVNVLWNFWLERLQRKLHRAADLYINNSKYENIRWLSPTINGSIELNHILYW